MSERQVSERGLVMSKIAFLGPGQMGTPMATRLLQAGHHVTVWDRTHGRATPLVERGADAAASPSDAAAGMDVAITMLATPDALEQVVFGDEGLALALGPGQVFIDMSTVGPETVGEVAARLPERVSMVDAPVRGSVLQAPRAGSMSSSARPTRASSGSVPSSSRSERYATPVGPGRVRG